MVRLTRAEMAFFKREGWLVVRGAMDQELCARARDRLWETSESAVLQRDVPSTWLGPLPESDLSRDGQNARSAYRWQWRRGGSEELLLDLLPRACLEIAEQLLGEGTLRELRPEGSPPVEARPVLAGKTPGPEIGTKCRGIYCTLPASVSTKPRSLNANACHTDGHPMSLGLVGLIDRVEPGGGSFAVWPRSHTRVFHKFKWQYSCRDETGKNDFTPEYEAELAKIKADTVPVDCAGEPGDVILWHHRTAHMAGQNYSRNIRQAVLYDYIKKEEFYDDSAPPEDMWRDWSDEMRELNENTGGLGEAARL